MPYRTILVVEDDLNDEHLTLRALRQSGIPCTVVVAHCGKDALHFLNRTGPFEGREGPEPLAIFVDHTLPGFGGVELIQAIRSNPALATVPVVVFSGSLDSNVVEQCCRAGANSFLEKPIEMESYVRQVNAAAKYWLTLNLAPSTLQDKVSAL
jgi:two-component system, response regulator